MKENEKIRGVVIPGEVIGETKKASPGYGTYEEDGKIISKFVGITTDKGNYLSVIPLSGVYIPKPQDSVIGMITEVEKAGWIVDINSPWQGFLSLSEAVDEFIDIRKANLTRYYDVGDMIYAQVVDTKRGDVQLSVRSPTARKLKNGVIVKITPSKVPRVIGKEGSMVNLIKEKTGTIIRVGQNGIVWISGENVEKAIKAIKLIEEKSHIYGLTDEISKLLSD
jgi:exosome complex component RRP4